ncbi:MAG: M81 family metallopeptidase [Alphaproteobacteria bacterium]|nr:M81 family metallopeptidase [Alphaproteobacteria bacterium]MCB9929282.1 M81 family metallopeptidase [Alphaproteobacteria bacterium]
MARIAVGGFHHETNTFAPTRASFDHFERTDGWPGLLRGTAMLPTLAGKNIPLAGFAAAAQSDWELLPTVWCNASPSAHVEEAAYEPIVRMLTEDLAALGPVDAVFLDLHGAMVCEHLEDGEGELLRRVRAIVGPDVPIVASLDLHANVTAAMVEHSDLLVGYRTYPHVDMAETGARCAALMARIFREGKPAKAWRKLDFLISINWQCSLVEPARSVYRAMAEGETGAIWSLSFTPGFPPADITDCGPAVLAYASSSPRAEAAAEAAASTIALQEDEFDGGYFTPAGAIAEAKTLLEQGVHPVVIADTQDNPGGGGDGNTAGMLAALVAERAENAVLGLYIDPDVAAKAHAAGTGREISACFGGFWPGDEKICLRAEVERLGDGRFHCTGGFYGGNDMDLGPMALLRLAGHDIRVVVASRKVQAADREMFRHVGVEPKDAAVLVLKSSVHFRADFTFDGGEILIATAPGPVTADPAELPYRHLRPGVRLGANGPVHRS